MIKNDLADTAVTYSMVAGSAAYVHTIAEAVSTTELVTMLLICALTFVKLIHNCFRLWQDWKHR